MNNRSFSAAIVLVLVLAGCDGIQRPGEFTEYPAHARPGQRPVMPPTAPFISQEFYAETEEGQSGHFGIDIWDKIGTPILAAAPGRVTRSNYEPIYGHVIEIEHGPDENGVPVRTVYLHMRQRTVSQGDVVARGQQIGTLGDSGALSALPHLHFEVNRRKGRRWIAHDPHEDWVNGPWQVTCFDPAQDIADLPFKITYPVVCH